MADLIDRQKAVEVFCSACGLNFPNCDMRRSGKQRYGICAVPALWELPTAQPEPRWIPVEEKLPEVGRRVLVTIPLVDGYPFARIARYGTQMFENKVCFYESVNECVDCEISGVTAWMPLPEPYKEDSDG